MRTTLDIDDDLLIAAKEIARRDGTSAGAVVSRLVRASLTGRVGEPAEAPAAGASLLRGRANAAGFRPFKARPGKVVTNEQVNRLRDELGI